VTRRIPAGEGFSKDAGLMFDEVNPRVSFPELERKVAAFWTERRIYEKSLERRANAPGFVFFEGPPTANGMPHPGHCLTRVVKDCFPRYFTMRGFRCERKAGWDTHGLPVEVEVGKQLGIHTKQEIEGYGVEPFVRQCIDSVFKYTREWEELTRRLGFWVNLDEAYVTYHREYVESVWWALATLFNKGMLYQGHKVVWWWAQGGTALSSGEVGEGYRDTDDPSIHVRFKLDQASAPASLRAHLDPAVTTSLLAWTTTPWTLPSHIALAVGETFDYVLIEYRTGAERERFLLAEALVPKVFAGLKIDLEKDLAVLAKVKGSELVGLKYEPIFRLAEPEGIDGSPTGAATAKRWEVTSGDFVSLDAGTGIVHIAPAFGEDDYRLCKEKGFGFLQLIRPDGTFGPEFPEVAGLFCKDADKKIIEILKSRGVLLKRENYRHPYPFCPRAENDPLIQYARRSWFIRTSQIKDRFLENNAAINWLPDHIKEGRMGDLLRNNVDWALSRERFWGTPLPIWECDQTGRQEAISSYAELLAKPDVRGLEVWEAAKKADPALPDHLMVHKPYIDSVHYASPHAPGARMRRVPEVIDCWFDSGAMPFAQWGFPHLNRAKFAEQYPADFISEAIDQTRGWFYSQLAIATLLKDEFAAAKAEFAKPGASTASLGYPLPFKTCIVLGHILGEDGRKMSKRLKNYREPTYIFDTYGADAMRWLFLSGAPPWNTARFQESAIQEVQREFLIRLHNVYSFFVIYANLDGWTPSEPAAGEPAALTELDRWIRSELARTVAFVTESMDGYRNFEAAGRLHEFVDALSNWYVRRSRDRFWAHGMSADKRAAYATLHECLTTLAKLLAPFTPFYAEELYRNLVRDRVPGGFESVHLCDWPEVDRSAIDDALSAEMALVREVVSAGRSARTEAKLKVRQPLSAVEVILADHRMDEVVRRHARLIADELNVKGVELPERAADYITVTVKPNLKVLGPRLGKKLGALQKALGSIDGAALRATLMAGAEFPLPLDGESLSLGRDDVMMSLAAKPGYAAAEGKGVVVVLSTEVTPVLRREGLARELIHAIQGMRKELNLAFDGRIALGVDTSGELAAALAEHRAFIAGEVLADRIEDDTLAQSAMAIDADLDGHTCRITLQPV
jgi:isoleucyl-tRNA synthetase